MTIEALKMCQENAIVLFHTKSPVICYNWGVAHKVWVCHIFL